MARREARSVSPKRPLVAQAARSNDERPLAAADIDRLMKRGRKLAHRYRIAGGKFRISDINPGDTGDLQAEDKPRSKEALRLGTQALAAFQDVLFAQDRWAVLLIFQGMDAAGKDGAIKHLMTGVNPQGCQVASFKQPSSEELDHDYLWRCVRHLPERGRIGIFNRSYYEELLVVRVHDELLHKQKLPEHLITKDIWKNRFRDICAFERYLSGNGVLIRKFFLHVSHKEQKRRFLERIDDPKKNWKFSAADAAERHHWQDYMQAYQEMIRHTATPGAPWYVVPADNKWFTRVVVASVVIDALASLDLHYPKITKQQRMQLLVAKRKLLAEK